MSMEEMWDLVLRINYVSGGKSYIDVDDKRITFNIDWKPNQNSWRRTFTKEEFENSKYDIIDMILRYARIAGISRNAYTSFYDTESI